MATQSKLTARGQIYVPAEVRRKLGFGPGSVLDWEEEGNRFVVRRAGRYSSTDIHDALFSRRRGPARSPAELKEALRSHIKSRHARR